MPGSLLKNRILEISETRTIFTVVPKCNLNRLPRQLPRLRISHPPIRNSESRYVQTIRFLLSCNTRMFVKYSFQRLLLLHPFKDFCFYCFLLNSFPPRIFSLPLFIMQEFPLCAILFCQTPAQNVSLFICFPYRKLLCSVPISGSMYIYFAPAAIIIKVCGFSA